MSNGFSISKETWDHMEPEQRDWIMFETMQTVSERVKALENRTLFDRTCSFLGGIIGGCAAMLGAKMIR